MLASLCNSSINPSIYACEISNALPGKNLKNEKGEPTTPFFLAFKAKPLACTTAPFQGGLPERPLGHNSWVRNYDPAREKAATGSAADISQSTQEEETCNDVSPQFVPYQDNSPPLFSDEQ
eukprot:15183649-Ditylum_brightwellii.AAC.1